MSDFGSALPVVVVQFGKICKEEGDALEAFVFLFYTCCVFR
jgi:hypothetical protein